MTRALEDGALGTWGFATGVCAGGYAQGGASPRNRRTAPLLILYRRIWELLSCAFGSFPWHVQVARLGLWARAFYRVRAAPGPGAAPLPAGLAPVLWLVLNTAPGGDGGYKMSPIVSTMAKAGNKQPDLGNTK